tara:strand:- start:1758 stop:1949 length:192 start_codon:yes stop_codon:yes gene_type:complete
MYGEGIFYIKNIDIWKNKLRLTVADSFGEDQFIFMGPDDAQKLVNDIWFKVEDYQNTIRQGIG